MDRWEQSSSCVRVTGGNEGAESVWGVAKMNLKQRAAHRGGATKHSTAHATSAIFLSGCPGLKYLGLAWKAWYVAHVDKAPPRGYFNRT
eukprot:7513046-Karenia_brevis.AAC.1